MNKIILTSLVIIYTTILISCTKQSMSRQFGNDIVINVERGYKVTSATWKENNLFYFIESMGNNYHPHEKMFIESSSYGIIESKVIFKESR